LKFLLMLALSALASVPAFAAADCAVARDPGRCEAQRAALKTCLEAALPPVDCSKASDPERCEKAQKAREVCNTKTGKDLKKCLRDEQPKKQRQARKSAAPKN
jgi:hypothetical protein